MLIDDEAPIVIIFFSIPMHLKDTDQNMSYDNYQDSKKMAAFADAKQLFTGQKKTKIEDSNMKK